MKTRFLSFEGLESRQLLAGGLASQFSVNPALAVVNEKVEALEILPGGQDQVVARMNMRGVGQSYGRLAELDFLPAVESVPLHTAYNYELWADLKGKKANDGPRRDGYETLIANGDIDWETDVLTFTPHRNVWARPCQNLKVQVVADFGGYFSDDQFGVELAFAGFYNLRKQPVPEHRVRYRGAESTLHDLKNASVNISQDQMLPFGSVFAGQEGVELLKFYSWNREALMDTVSFTVMQGNLQDLENFILKTDVNHDGQYDLFVTGAVNQDNTVTFEPTFSVSGYRTVVCADVVQAPISDTIQLGFAGVTGHETETGLPLKGIRLNGNGEGQIGLWAYANYATTYNIVVQPELVVKELGGGDSVNYAQPGDTIVLDAGTFYVPANDVTISSVAVMVTGGNVISVNNFAFWVDTNSDNQVDTRIGEQAVVEGMNVSFINLELNISAGQSVLYEVRADVPDPLSGGNYIQVQLAGAQGVKARRADDNSVLALDKVFAECQRQPGWIFDQPVGVTMELLLQQLAQLQAQLLALQGDGLG